MYFATFSEDSLAKLVLLCGIKISTISSVLYKFCTEGNRPIQGAFTGLDPSRGLPTDGTVGFVLGTYNLTFGGHETRLERCNPYRNTHMRSLQILNY
jgi:hypothetical protein